MAVYVGRRIYDNNVFGTVADSPLLVGATTLNAAGLANLSAVASNHAVIVLDPLRSDGAPEIVIVTAHTASATSATISRGAYGTVARQHAAGTLWVHASTKDDLIQVLTANPSDNHEGQLWFRSDTDIFMAHDGTNAVEALPIGAWQSWTPSVTQSGSVTVTVTRARYTRLGRLITFMADLAVTGSGTSANSIVITAPVAAAYASFQVVGVGNLFDTSAGSDYAGVVRFFNSTTNLTIFNSSAPTGNLGTTGFTAGLANGDSIRISGTYEAAS